MKTLANLTPSKGSKRARKRVGRGIGSGLGKTCGKGHKGQKARKGGGIAPGFEGGQTPLYRRLPKYGFSNKKFETVYECISLESLNTFNDGEVVNREGLVKSGLIKHARCLVKILANGKLERKLDIKVNKISKGARVAIESNGGTVEEI